MTWLEIVASGKMCKIAAAPAGTYDMPPQQNHTESSGPAERANIAFDHRGRFQYPCILGVRRRSMRKTRRAQSPGSQ